jgi:hypothetical protein
MIARHFGHPSKCVQSPYWTLYTTHIVIDDFGNELRLQLTDNGMPTAQCMSIWAFLNGHWSR